MSASLPPRPPPEASPASPRHALGQVPHAVQRNRKTRPIVYTIAVAGIVASGVWIGAILKGDQQHETAKKTQQQLLSPQPVQNSFDHAAPRVIESGAEADREAAFAKSLNALQTKRAYLVDQKLSLEKKIQDFREDRRRKVEEERQIKELGLKR